MNKIQIQIGVSQRCNITTKRKQFNSQANVMAFLYQRFITEKTKGLQKITLELFDTKKELNIGDFSKTISVCVIDRTFDFKNYFSKEKQEQKKMILFALHDSVLQMCKKFALDKTPFINAYDKVIENNYKNQYIFNKLTLSKNRKHKAGIEINMTEKGADINIIFTDKNETFIKRETIFRTQPHYFFVYQIIHSGRWIDNDKYIASSKNKNVNFIASIDSDNVEIDIQPKEKEKEILEKLNKLRF